ncbi:MAG: transcription elongation factor Spt5 [Aigarchaeota archaeon]|nr:transcription elongation factor Spt5 [Candidatus Pelearchaeum maunauluense]
MSSAGYRYFAVKTTVGQERNVARIIEARLTEVLVETTGEPFEAWRINAESRAYQTFTAPKTTTISKLYLYLGREGELTAPLHADFYRVGEYGVSLENKISGVKYDPLLLSEPGWYEVNIEPMIDVRRGVSYALVLSAPDCASGSYLWYKTASKTYAEGKAFTGGKDDGWIEQSFDFLFRIREKIDVASILILPTVRGYVLIEAKNKEAVAAVSQGIRHIKNRPLITVTFDEIAAHLVEKPLIDIITTGQVVEIVSGPLRGMVGKVIRIDKPKREITLELSEAAFPLPISVPVDAVRILDEAKTRGMG